MANWYSGVLNTGKRRYGHPALNGVLPEPWLPLKKGQSLVNSSNRSNERAQRGEDGDAVVLTLRKRHSRPLRRASSARGPGRDSTVMNGNGLDAGEEGLVDPIANPWQDAGASSRRRQQPNRAMSEPLNYDHASGVIILPDEDGWLEEEEADSDEVVNGLDQSMTESMMSLREGGASTDGEGGEGEATPLNTGRQSRYGTYFHHPERRRQQIPGAFPR